MSCENEYLNLNVFIHFIIEHKKIQTYLRKYNYTTLQTLIVKTK